MEIRSILVNVDLEQVDTPALRFAVDLARTLDARIIGIGADEPHLVVGEFDQGFATQQVYEAELSQITAQLSEAGERFQSLVPAGIDARWRPAVVGTTSCLIEASTEADMIVTDPGPMSSWARTGKVDIGELVLRSGRPVTVVGDRAKGPEIKTVVVGWKNTREARRALADAMPLLQRAQAVSIVTVGEGDRRSEQRSLDEATDWLKRHGVAARSELLAPDRTVPLTELAAARDADLLVTGCYGHSRGLELLFGGVTRRLLEADQLTRLLSH
ncbi:hypothetical protein VW23_019740 [Devosia insulae DS-56]|uniref:UspA domain-containing protein n=1 Tax=Devosia insulae DS-56 TaxID=1116389 RepID=A0A1E5XQ39_9HYPH|nr:universal stress protein [Devosia insulae]OEO30703.1 hypothetical protein VW23_019740 [Devosia insulae DS-56]